MATKIGPMNTAELEFYFEKGFFFRVVHVDGAFGGVAPAGGQIHMSVYNERHPIPQKAVHEVNHGMLGKEITEKRVTRPGIYREVEADLVFNLQTAIAIRSWLDDRIKELQQANEVTEAILESQKEQAAMTTSPTLALQAFSSASPQTAFLEQPRRYVASASAS